MLYRKKWYLAILFALPFAVFACLFLFYPAIINIYNSFFKFQHQLDQNPVFFGFKNYVNLFKKFEFWRSLINTGILIVCVIVFQVGTALLLALLVNNMRRGSGFFRIVFFMPIVVSATAIGLLYLIFIQPSGLFTQIFTNKEAFNWLPSGSPRALVTVLIPILWQCVGFYFVILLTGLAGIPEDIIEAARIDGASTLRLNLTIIMPMLWNVFRTCMVLAITGALKVFDLPHIFAPDGAPNLETVFMGTYNNYLYSSNRLGQSSVYSILIVVVGILVSGLSNLALRENKDIE